MCSYILEKLINLSYAARKETAREKQLKEEEKILESVAEKTGKLRESVAETFRSFCHAYWLRYEISVIVLQFRYLTLLLSPVDV